MNYAIVDDERERVAKQSTNMKKRRREKKIGKPIMDIRTMHVYV